MNDERAKLVAGMRELATWLEANPDVEMNSVVTICKWVSSEELPKVAHLIGSAEKSTSDLWFSLVKNFGPLRLEWFCNREAVCKRVLKETVTLPAEPEQVVTIPAKPERTQEVYEWVCPESILAAKPADDPPPFETPAGFVESLSPETEGAAS